MRLKTKPLVVALFLPFTLIAQDFSIFQYRNVGPLRGGRATAVAGTKAEPGTFYVGYTGSGVWKSTDYGTTWNNVSDKFFETPSIGAIAVDQHDPNVVYVGTGSDGLRSNVIEGRGVYKSVDGGKTWEHTGLKNVGQIGAVEIHPENHNVVYVAAIGKAFQSNEERGVYKTMDGGLTWQKILYHSDKVGFSDLVLLPGNPETVFATAWKAERKPWTIMSGGSAQEGGIYKSVNGGKNWTKVNLGLPNKLIGKIDLAISAADTKIIYALVEAPDSLGGVYKSVNQGKSFKLVSNNKGLRTRPFYYTNIEVDPKNPKRIYVMATGYYKSEDGGKKWSRMSSPHGDNHAMWINPDHPNLFIQSN
ncbi:MAG: WD40/YVTN/BNR-like repeat-containing protein, partial [Fulvivirga sp.]